ncbi:MAG: cytidine deaminase [Syntrophomonadaceae bacterium]|jgi:cytidine deaminase
MTTENLVMAAMEAQKYSYAPYSGYKVGAAILCSNGKIFSGTNIENASYGLTVCAERVAIFKAISEGQRDWDKIAIYSDGKSLPLPCGACLQVMFEFCPDLKIIATNNGTDYNEYKLVELLPNAFSL